MNFRYCILQNNHPPGGVEPGERREDMKKYRVNESEHFNLMSMYDHLKCLEIDARDNSNWDALEKVEERLEEVESLLEAAYCVGALVTWPQLKRIREIRDERNAIRYNIAIQNGENDQDAGYAIM